MGDTSVLTEEAVPSDEVFLRECPTRAGLEVLLERDGTCLTGELEGHDQAPRTMSRRVLRAPELWTASRVATREVRPT